MYLNKNLLISISFLLILTCTILYFSLTLTQFNFTYALDDAYIHLSIAQNIIENGIWGVDNIHNGLASSSPLWTIILVVFLKVIPTSIHEYIPFVLNTIFQIFLIYFLLDILKKYLKINHQYLVIIMILSITPIWALTFGGMEHSLQLLLLTITFKYFLLILENPNNKNYQNTILFLSPLIVFVRYENFAYICMLALILFWNTKKVRLTLSILIASLSLVLVYGLWTKFYLNMSFLPTSVMVKSVFISESDIIQKVIITLENFYNNSTKIHIIMLYIINIFLLYKAYTEKNKLFLSSTLLILSTLIIHLTFAKIGWLFRYEAYLILLTILNLAIAINSFYKIEQIMKNKSFIWILIIFFHIQLFISPLIIVKSTQNIFEQQIQMSNFLKQECNNCNIAANDIGAITYFTNIKLLDLFGLSSQEVFLLKKQNNYTSNEVNKLLEKNNVSLIMIYESWFPDFEFQKYTKIGEWEIKNNVICGDSKVSFYSHNNELKRNRSAFEKFSKQNLSKKVIIKKVVPNE